VSFEILEQREIAHVTRDVIQRSSASRGRLEQLEAPEIQDEITRIVAMVMAPSPESFEIIERTVGVAAIVANVTKRLVLHAISNPEIAVDVTDANFEIRPVRNNAIAVRIPLPIFAFRSISTVHAFGCTGL